MKRLILLISMLAALAAYSQYSPGVVKIYDESEIDSLLDEGVEIMRRRGDILLCLFPRKDDTIIIPNSIPKKAPRGETPRKNLNTPTLDYALSYFDAYKIQAGEVAQTPFTGKGVVVGICDIGLDPLHPTFLDEEGHSRIRRITQYNEYEGWSLTLEGDEAYADWKTDTYDDFHATHVAGILAGRGADTPYRGVATDADIVVSLSCLSDYGLLMGVEDIIDYAREVGKPAVINLSMGNYVGAHDGTSLFSQYLDLCAEEAIIVLSAGNEGNQAVSLQKSLDDNVSSFSFRLGSRDWSQKNMYGMTDIWNSSSRPLTVTIGIFDDETHTKVFEYDPVELPDEGYVSYQWDPEEPLFEGLSLNGSLTVYSGIDPENGRYEVALVYNYESTRLIGTGWAKDMVYVTVSGVTGDEVEVFADATYTRLMSIIGQPAPDSSFSISDLSCGSRVVSVGMYGDRSTFPVNVFSAGASPSETMWRETGDTEGGTVIHSSYGTLRDGRILPLTVAPGMPLVSSISRYYLSEHHEDYYMASDGSQWLAMGGTSMSSPYVAGYIATWLEAEPDLTPEKVLEIIALTNRHDIAEPADPRNLSGYFDPLSALRRLLDDSGITQISNPLSLLLPDDPVTLYDLTGRRLFSGTYSAYLDLAPTLPGLHLLHTPYGIIKSLQNP